MSEATLYEEDLVLWTERQAHLLRQAATRRANEAIDWENVAEEIETLGRSKATAVCTRMARIIEHLLKLQFSPATAPRRLWEESIRAQRLRVEDLLEDSPSLRGRLEGKLPRAARLGTSYAIESLLRNGEETAIEAIRTHGGRYSVDEVIGDWTPAGPAGP